MKLRTLVVVSLLASIGHSIYKIHTIKLGKAWDDGYRTGREAEREDWNWPTGVRH